MINQTRMHFISLDNLISIAPAGPDKNFYEDVEQLAVELAAPLPDALACQPLPEIDPDEFERLYTWFLS